jgi:HSP20 family molecular chaperone IbpA
MMKRRDPAAWMWAEAVDLMEQAERMHRQFFRMATTGAPERPRWEPPADVYSSDDEVLVEIALPGVPTDRIELLLAHGELVVRGERRPPRPPTGTAIHRLEIPYGRFERRLALPPGTWELAAQDLANGCLKLLLARR